MALLTQQAKDVEFQDISYAVMQRNHFLKVTANREILRGVSGCFRNGQLSAIMGPSGAGKSSLLNAISGYRTQGVSGHIKIDRNQSCYITQEDHHQTLFTVEELMHFASELRSVRDGDTSMTNRAKSDQIITEILENLNLNHRRSLTAKQLSGGERKRLSIALELVANPTICFLDEPTSGLDEVTAAQCIALLSGLAKQGRTIVCTIHQPSATIFNYFDRIFILARGQCVYQGTPAALLPFLRHIHLECPKTYSPSDYIMEICDIDEGKFIPLLSEATDNGKLVFAPNQKADDHSAYDFRQAITTLFIDTRSESGRTHAPFFGGVNSGSGAAALLERMKAFSKRMYTDGPGIDVSTLHQFNVLLRMMLIRIWRSRIALCIQVVHHVMCGLFFGLTFLNSGNEGERMFDHLKFCIGTVLVIVYTQVMLPILSYPGEVSLVKKQTFNRWYKLTPYFAALNISRLPLQFVLNLIFLAITYSMAGLPQQWWRFGLFVAVGQVTSLVAEGMGLFIGATFSITNGSAVGPLAIAPIMGIACYGFDFAAQIPVFMNFLMRCSYIRVSVEAVVLVIFGYGRENLDCGDVYCHFSDTRVLLKFLNIDRVSLANLFLLMGFFVLIFRTMLYVSLRIRCRT